MAVLPEKRARRSARGRCAPMRAQQAAAVAVALRLRVDADIENMRFTRGDADDAIADDDVLLHQQPRRIAGVAGSRGKCRRSTETDTRGFRSPSPCPMSALAHGAQESSTPAPRVRRTTTTACSLRACSRPHAARRRSRGPPPQGAQLRPQRAFGEGIGAQGARCAGQVLVETHGVFGIHRCARPRAAARGSAGRRAASPGSGDTDRAIHRQSHRLQGCRAAVRSRTALTRLPAVDLRAIRREISGPKTAKVANTEQQHLRRIDHQPDDGDHHRKQHERTEYGRPAGQACRP